MIILYFVQQRTTHDFVYPSAGSSVCDSRGFHHDLIPTSLQKTARGQSSGGAGGPPSAPAGAWRMWLATSPASQHDCADTFRLPDAVAMEMAEVPPACAPLRCASRAIRAGGTRHQPIEWGQLTFIRLTGSDERHSSVAACRARCSIQCRHRLTVFKAETHGHRGLNLVSRCARAISLSTWPQRLPCHPTGAGEASPPACALDSRHDIAIQRLH